MRITTIRLGLASLKKMFDVGFAELVLIAVVGLLVIGPEQLPDTIKTLSAWLNKIRRSYNDIRMEVQQELHNESILKELRDTGEYIKNESEEIENAIEKQYGELSSELSEFPPAKADNIAVDSIKDHSK